MNYEFKSYKSVFVGSSFMAVASYINNVRKMVLVTCTIPIETFADKLAKRLSLCPRCRNKKNANCFLFRLFISKIQNA